MPFADTNGLRTHYEASGEASAQAVALIHGHSVDLRVWKYQVQPLLDSGFRVVRHDVRGHGRSGAPPTGYTWDNYSTDLCSLLDHLGVERVHVAGFSMGGGAALKFTLDHPDRVMSLTLVDSALPGFTYSPEFSDHIVELQEAVCAEGVAVAFEKHWFTHPIFDGLRRFPDRMAEVKQMASGYSAVEYREDSATPDYAQPDLTASLHEVSAPTLVVVGEDDLPDFRLIAEITSATIPNAQLELIPDCGHVPPMEKPEEFNRILIDFLKDNSSAV